MNRDEFFKSLDSEISSLDEKEAAEAKREAEREEEVKRILQQAVSILDEYSGQLQAKGVTVSFKHDDPVSLRFVLCYRDGHRYGFRLGKESRTISGRVYSVYSTVMIPKRPDKTLREDVWMSPPPPLNQDWSRPDFEEFVQGVIREFFTAADKHGGYKEAPDSGWDSDS